MANGMVEKNHWNTVYLLSALSTIFMTLAIAVQPLYLRNVLGISFEMAGSINASVQVVTEILDMMLIGYLGFLSDRYGRIPIMMIGFIVAAIGAALATFSLELGAAIGIGGLAFYYLMRIVMSLGTGAVWPQLSTLAGDFTTFENRARQMSNTAFMMAFGATLVYAVLMQLPQHAGIWTVMLLPALIAIAGAWLTRHRLIDVAPRLDEKKMPWDRIRALLASEQRLRLTFASAFFARSDMVFIGLFLMLWYIYFADLVGIGQEEAAAHAGKLIGLFGAVVLITLPFWGWLIERYDRVSAIILGMALSGAGFLLYGFIVNPFDWGIIVPTVLVAVGQAGCLVAPQVLTLDLTPKEIRGSVFGLFNLMGGIGIIIFIQIGGYLYDTVGPHAPFMMIGVLNLVIMLYAVWVLRASLRARKPAFEEEM
ncbi:MAG: MFS transporter [Alphaproteobacteria bacterium]|nr:MFS transporter [Alphaproteobacteria bacterium]MBF0251961.1 MFS transporter [Alphaproteobacteria bacterium]